MSAFLPPITQATNSARCGMWPTRATRLGTRAEEVSRQLLGPALRVESGRFGDLDFAELGRLQHDFRGPLGANERARDDEVELEAALSQELAEGGGLLPSLFAEGPMIVFRDLLFTKGEGIGVTNQIQLHSDLREKAEREVLSVYGQGRGNASDSPTAPQAPRTSLRRHAGR